MHFHETAQPYLRYRLWILVFVLAVTAATALFSALQEPRYATSLSITVNRINRQPTADYQYDGYYAIQATDLFSQTLLSWFLTPSALLEFYTRAGIDPHIRSLNELTGRFRARKFAAQNLVVQFTEAHRVTAEKLAMAISDVVKERGTSVDTNVDGSATFAIAPASPVIVETKPNILLNTLAAFIGSFLLALAVVGTLRYLRT